jgi:CRISPR/Cas system-associated exonuclease Cas4 (RecB family)
VPFKERHLSVYMRCPRQYYYEFQLGLSGRREDSAYVQFHQCVYRVLRWLRSQDSPVSVSDAVAQLDTEWSTRGPRDHPYADVYYASARNMVERWAGRPTRSRSLPAEADWEVQLKHGRVSFVPDNIEEQDDGTLLVERLRTGRPTKTELEDEIYALYTAGAPPAAQPQSRTVQVRYLATDQVEPVVLKPRSVDSRLAKYDAAIVGILNEDYPPEPNDRVCPRCPNYFICPGA